MANITQQWTQWTALRNTVLGLYEFFPIQHSYIQITMNQRDSRPSLIVFYNTSISLLWLTVSKYFSKSISTAYLYPAVM